MKFWKKILILVLAALVLAGGKLKDLTEETTPAGADLIYLEKSATADARKVQITNLPGGGASDSFRTHNTPSGTDPVADSTTDTLNWTAGTGITISGDSGTDTITITNSAPNADQNLFATIATTSGTAPAADATNDTLTLTAGSGITITGDSGTDTVTIAATGGGSGDVVGPASATDNAVARFDTTTGKLIQNGAVLVDDSGNVSGVGNITLSGTVDGRDVATDGTKLDGVESGAQADQNLFSTINATSGTDPVADAVTDTLNLSAGTGITVTGDSGTDTITIATTVVDTDEESFQTIDTESGTDPVADGVADTLVITGSNGVTVTGTAASDTVDIGISAGGISATELGADAVTNAKAADMANATTKCRTTAGSGDPEDCTATQVRAILGQQIIQQVFDSDEAHTSGTNLVPTDDTAPPQKGESNIFMTPSITPTSTSNYLEITGILFLSISAAPAHIVVNIFDDGDGTNDAIYTAGMYVTAADSIMAVPIHHRMTAPRTSATTFSIGASRAGASATTTYFNSAGTSPFFAGTMISSVTINEIAP